MLSNRDARTMSALLDSLDFLQPESTSSQGQGGWVRGSCILEEVLFVLLNEASLHLALDELGMLSDSLDEADVGVQANNLVLLKGSAEATESIVTVLAMDNQFGDHGVVVNADLISLDEACLQTDILAGQGSAHTEEWSGIRKEVAIAKQMLVRSRYTHCYKRNLLGGVLSIDTSFKGMAMQSELILSHQKGVACSDLQLPANQIGLGDHFSNGMLHLQTRVHLHKVELLVDIVHDELDGTGVLVVDGASSSDSLGAQFGTQLFSQARGRGLFNDLLMASLDRAIALKQVDDVVVLVGKHLDFDVARTLQVLFDQHLVVAKGLDGLALGRLEHLFKLRGRSHDTHTFASAALDGLDQDGIANLLGLVLEEPDVLVFAVVAWNDRDTGVLHDEFRLTEGLHQKKKKCEKKIVNDRGITKFTF